MNNPNENKQPQQTSVPTAPKTPSVNNGGNKPMSQPKSSGNVAKQPTLQKKAPEGFSKAKVAPGSPNKKCLQKQDSQH